MAGVVGYGNILCRVQRAGFDKNYHQQFPPTILEDVGFLILLIIVPPRARFFRKHTRFDWEKHNVLIKFITTNWL